MRKTIAFICVALVAGLLVGSFTTYRIIRYNDLQKKINDAKIVNKIINDIEVKWYAKYKAATKTTADLIKKFHSTHRTIVTSELDGMLLHKQADQSQPFFLDNGRARAQLSDQSGQSIEQPLYCYKASQVEELYNIAGEGDQAIVQLNALQELQHAQQK